PTITPQLKVDSSPLMDKTPRGGLHVVTAQLAAADRLSCDDTRIRVVDVVSQLKMLIVEGQRSQGSLGGSGVYLHAALDPTGAAGESDHPAGAPASTNPADSAGRSYVAPEIISDLE